MFALPLLRALNFARACGAFPLVLLALASSLRAEEGAATVPLKKVVLFNSGVGFFERRAEIDGDVRVDLQFNADDVNDLLQSMVLEDLGGGSISTVTYGSKEPITRTLGAFGIDLTDEPTLGALLRQVRGEKVRIDATNAVEGVIIGVEMRPERVGEDKIIETETLNLLTDEGLASVPLAGVRRIKLVNEQLDAELRQALASLAMAHAADKKTVTLNFSGDKRRAVRVGYTQETPIWKTSYRLVLGGDEPAFLQGWALVENATEEDWTDVSLTLVSGRPISFVMDLYQSLYVARPVVAPELFGAVRPQTYDQDLALKEQQFRQQAGRGGRGYFGGGMGGMGMGGGYGLGGMPGPPPAKSEPPMNIAQGVPTAANASDVGELFQYEIKQPVSLARQKSAMLPIVNEAVEAQKLSIYNPRVHAKHPLNGARLKNSTRVHLMQGPITVFDAGAYAGNARILDLPPGSERLISYALDLETEIAAEQTARPQRLASLKIVDGVAIATSIAERTQSYVAKNSGDKPKQLLIEYPLDVEWKLIEPQQPAEKTRELYRFALEAQPGEPAKLEIHEQQPIEERVAVNDLNNQTVAIYLAAKEISPEVKAALAEVQKRKCDLTDLQQQLERLEGRTAAISG
ncbi:MAG TPA: hypothetical protein VHB99_16385, partial [Pirellulales bacterium]|nr:hypothetical protein [Pirellulales bacterium]